MMWFNKVRSYMMRLYMRRFYLMRFYWLEPGQIAGSSIPVSAAGIERWRREGVQAAVSLVADELDLSGLETLHLPVPDFTAPTQDQLDVAVRFINGQVVAKRPVVVHCLGGKGRTGTVLAAWLISQGQDVAGAAARVRAAAPGSIETAEQLACLDAFALRSDESGPHGG